MKNNYFRYCVVLFSLVLISFTCSSEEDTVTEPATTGAIKGEVIEQGSNDLVSYARVYTLPATDNALTSEQGYYRINTVEPGDYTIYCVKENYDTVTAGIKVIAGYDATANFTMVLSDSSRKYKVGNISGVVNDISTDQPIADVTITTTPVTEILKTDVTGNFSFTDLDPGTYSITAKKTNYINVSVDVVVSSNKTTSAIIDMSPDNYTDSTQLGNIEGVIIDVTTSEPVANAIISTNPTSGTKITGSDGTYKFENVSPGNYKVKFVKTGYVADSTEVTVVANTTVNSDMLVTPATGSITGRVVDKNNSPINLVMIRTTPDIGSYFTEPTGSFDLQNLEPDTYTLIFSKQNYVSDTTSVKVEAGQISTTNIILQTP